MLSRGISIRSTIQTATAARGGLKQLSMFLGTVHIMISCELLYVAHLRRRLRRAQPCFVYATIVTQPDSDLIVHVRVVQSTLVDTWQSMATSHPELHQRVISRDPGMLRKQTAVR